MARVSTLVAAYVAACGGAPAPHDRATSTSAAADNRGTVRVHTEESSMIEVKAADAQAKGLPGIGFRVDSTGTSLSLGTFPEPDKYLIASGPPGGPLVAIVWPADERDGDVAAVERTVRRHYSNPWEQPLVVGEPGTITIGGTQRPALAFTTGQGMGRIGWCGALVTGQSASVLVTFGRGVRQGALSCADVMAEPNLAAFARTFALI